MCHGGVWPGAFGGYDSPIGVGAQSTLGGDIFARKYMHEKLTKCPNFT